MAHFLFAFEMVERTAANYEKVIKLFRWITVTTFLLIYYSVHGSEVYNSSITVTMARSGC